MIDKHRLEYTECDFKREVERTKTKSWLKSVCAFAKHTAEQSGGHLEITSKEGVGTTIKATMQHDHIDRPILGSVAAVFVQTVASNPEIRFIYTHTKDGQSYVFDTKEVNEALDGMPIQSPEVINYLISMINENLKEIGVPEGHREPYKVMNGLLILVLFETCEISVQG